MMSKRIVLVAKVRQGMSGLVLLIRCMAFPSVSTCIGSLSPEGRVSWRGPLTVSLTNTVVGRYGLPVRCCLGTLNILGTRNGRAGVCHPIYTFMTAHTSDIPISFSSPSRDHGWFPRTRPSYIPWATPSVRILTSRAPEIHGISNKP